MNDSRAAFEVKSNLVPGQAIPEDYYGNQFGYQGRNQSPSLEWSQAPQGTKSFAITFFDLDAPTGSGFWHYVLYNIPVGVTRVALGDLAAGKIPAGSVESLTDAGKPGFLGPCPPPGRRHRYVYTIHALKTDRLDIPAGATPAFVAFNLWANRLAMASFEVNAGKTA